MDGLEIIAIASAVLTLSVYVANQYGELSVNNFWYDLANLVSSIGLFSYALSLGIIPFILTNAVWGLVSGIDVAKYLLKRKGLKKRQR